MSDEEHTDQEPAPEYLEVDDLEQYMLDGYYRGYKVMLDHSLPPDTRCVYYAMMISAEMSRLEGRPICNTLTEFSEETLDRSVASLLKANYIGRDKNGLLYISTIAGFAHVTLPADLVEGAA